jgi:hypothetical protein
LIALISKNDARTAFGVTDNRGGARTIAAAPQGSDEVKIHAAFGIFNIIDDTLKYFAPLE